MRKKEFTQCKVNLITEYLNKVMTLSGAFDQSFITNGICSATITPEFTNDVAPFQFQPCYTKDDDFNKIFCLSKKSTSRFEVTATCLASHILTL